ncbi:hypothetical protein CEXT_471051 [Caerostris extrusa]|uniref:Uncharacterized protein n=1 Tax=Caerostris extrusa TaxID=172846 RepID=A0AAV4PYH0_CAEEX|nr:hypothetical protein CEXT_471051 [Caerostris extrusa]
MQWWHVSRTIDAFKNYLLKLTNLCIDFSPSAGGTRARWLMAACNSLPTPHSRKMFKGVFRWAGTVQLGNSHSLKPLRIIINADGEEETEFSFEKKVS